MKKVFLSLAALAFVATSSLTITSCGSDEEETVLPGGGNNGGGNNGGGNNGGGNNGGGNNGGGNTTDPTTQSGKIVFNGQEYGLDIAISQVYGVRNNNNQTVVSGYRLPINNGQDTIMTTRWNIIAFNGTDADAAENYHQLSVYIPVDGDNVVAPNAAETFYYAGHAVYAGNATTPIDLGQMSSFNVEFNVFDDQNGTVNYITSLTGANGTATSQYNGELDGTYYYVPTTSGRGVNVRPKSLGVKINSTKSLKLSKESLLAE